MGSMHLDACWSKSSQQAAAGSFLSAGCVCVVVVVVCVVCAPAHTRTCKPALLQQERAQVAALSRAQQPSSLCPL